MNRIRELRKQKKMTQKELAIHLKIADSTLSYWEMGKYEPDNESLRKLSRFFHVSIDYILGGDVTEWEKSSGRAPHSDAHKSSLGDTGSSFSDTKAVYKATTVNDDSVNFIPNGVQSGEPSDLSVPDMANSASVPNTTCNLGDAMVAFRRSEFEGLTPEEIDKLAEYAEFIKTQRIKKRVLSGHG